MNKLLRLSFAGLLLLAGCSKNSEPAPAPTLSSLSLPLQGEPWNLVQQTQVTTNHQSGALTTSTTTVVAGAYSIRFDKTGMYHVFTGGAKQEDYYAYDGKTITLQGAIGASSTRALTVSSVSASQLVTVEHEEDNTATYQSTFTFTR
jgi:hypothetical protein